MAKKAIMNKLPLHARKTNKNAKKGKGVVDVETDYQGTDSESQAAFIKASQGDKAKGPRKSAKEIAIAFAKQKDTPSKTS